MVDYLKDFIKSIKKLIDLYGDRDKTVRAAVTTPTEQLQYIADTFEEVLRQTAETKKTTTETGGVKASLSKADITDVQSFKTHKDIRYSVKRDVDGNKFVDVNPELFDARDGESHAKTIARIIKDRFNNLISVNGQQIQINKTTNDE